MRALPSATRSAVHAVDDALAHYSLDGDNMQAALEALRELMDTDKVFLYSLEQRPDSEDLRVARAATVSVKRPGWREAFDEYLTGHGVSWGVYNAVRPEPAQRDRVLDADELSALTGGRSRAVFQHLFARIDALGHDTMRVLVCDGPSLLACVAIVQPDKTTSRQRELFELVVPCVSQAPRVRAVRCRGPRSQAARSPPRSST